MTRRSPASQTLRNILLGSAAICLLTLGLPPVSHVGGTAVARAQTESGHKGGAGGGGNDQRGSGGSALHGAGGQRDSGTSGASGGGSAATHGSTSSSGGKPSTAGGGSSEAHGSGSGSGGKPSTAGESGSGGSGSGGGGTTSSRGKPNWSSGGIPEVELGRLSVARSPSKVIDKALTDAITNWTTLGSTKLTLTADGQPTLTLTVAELYSKSASDFAILVQTYYDSISRIDSPLENLALLKDLGTKGTTSLTDVKPASIADLEAIFLGSAADKTIPVTADTVTAVYKILGLPTPTADLAAIIAAKADAVRQAIAAGEG